MKNKTKKGFTLLELIIAIAVLAIATVPIYNMFMTSNRFNAQSHKLSVATFTAQMRMEELVGLNLEQLGFDEDEEGNITPLQVTEGPDLYNGFKVKVVCEQYEDTDTGIVYPTLFKATVTVYEHDEVTVLCTEENILNVDGNPDPTS
jgi:prepilin-type N-terminal cleavage/methylation domain-containing protein